MARKIAKFALKIILGIVGVVWIAASPSTWGGLVILVSSTAVLVLLIITLGCLGEDETEVAKEEFHRN